MLLFKLHGCVLPISFFRKVGNQKTEARCKANYTKPSNRYFNDIANGDMFGQLSQCHTVLDSKKE